MIFAPANRFSSLVGCSGAGHLPGVLLPYHGGLVLGVQHVQGAESEGGHGLPGSAATRKLVRDDVSRRAGGCRNGLAAGLLRKKKE